MQFLPVISIIGRPNVGKSTLFNCLTKSRDALVVDFAGTTRDRLYGEGKVGDIPYIVIDTGGIGQEIHELDRLMSEQTWHAIDESDLVLFVVDAKSGPTGVDKEIAKKLFKTNKKVILVVNKIDGEDESSVASEFFNLGFSDVSPIAASHNRGINNLAKAYLSDIPKAEIIPDEELGIKVSIIGKPNVGKSTLLNRILGENRSIAADLPGTTTSCVYSSYERKGKKYTLIDTAGVRRNAKVTKTVERFSIVKSLQAIENSNVCVLIIDAQSGIAKQDLSLLDFTIQSGRALVIAFNKWDSIDAEQKEEIKKTLSYKLQFANFAKFHFISAKHGSGVGNLFESINKAYACATKKHSTSKLTDILLKLTAKYPPPMSKGNRIKLRFAHPGGYNPPRIIIHGNQTQSLPPNYVKYLINNFQSILKIEGTPIKIEFKTGDNPYKEKKNTLTPRQKRKRERMLKHVKKKTKK